MASHDELSQLTAAELAGRIRRRDLSPVEVMDAAIARIETGNERLNAFVHLDLDHAREQARQAEHAVTAGAELGPLHGIPTAMTDLFDFKPGWPTTLGGVRALRDFVVDFYCTWAERMERAGAIIVGKTNSPIMGFRGTCDNPQLFKRQGMDLLAHHRDDFPAEYLRWIDEGYEMRTADLMRDEEIRSEIYDAIQDVLEDHRLLVTPTVACLPVKNATDGNTKGPTEINGVEVDPLIGWCLTYPVNFSGHPPPRSRLAWPMPCPSACKSSGAATPTPTYSPPAPRSNGCARGVTPIAWPL